MSQYPLNKGFCIGAGAIAHPSSTYGFVDKKDFKRKIARRLSLKHRVMSNATGIDSKRNGRLRSSRKRPTHIQLARISEDKIGPDQFDAVICGLFGPPNLAAPRVRCVLLTRMVRANRV